VNPAPTSAAVRRGRRLAVVLSALALAVAAFLWFGAGYRAANDCRDGAYGIPSADAVRFSKAVARKPSMASGPTRCRPETTPSLWRR